MTAAVRVSVMGCGWLGLPLAGELVRRGYAVKGSTTRAARRDELQARGVTPFVLAVTPEVSGEDADTFFDADVLVLTIPPGRAPDAAERYPDIIRSVARRVAGAGRPFVIFTSSTSVYPDVNREVTEEEQTPPDKPSGRAILQAERILASATAFDCTILRCAGLIGPGRTPGRFLAGKQNVRNGAAPVNLVHLDDVVAIVCEIIARNIRREIFNVVADAHPLRRDYYTRAAAALGLPAPSFLEDEPATWKIVTNARLKSRWGYVFRHPDPSTCLNE